MPAQPFDWSGYLVDANGNQVTPTANDDKLVGGMENQPRAADGYRVGGPGSAVPQVGGSIAYDENGRAYHPGQTGGTWSQPTFGGAASGGDDFASKMRQVIIQKHPEWSPDQVQQQVQYYLNKRADPTEVSAWATGEPGRTMDDYWLGRESGAIPADGGGGSMGYGGMGNMGGLSLGSNSPLSSFGAQGLIAPWTQQYHPPNVTDDPGFQFRLDQGQKALERSAASKGTLLTGGTLKDLANYAQGLASQEYAAADARDFRNYQNDENTFYANQNGAFNKLSGLAGYGLQAAGMGMTGAGLGLNAANSAGQYASTYGANSANLASGQGNANAAGSVANSNANNSIYSTLGNIDWSKIFKPRSASGTFGPMGEEMGQ